MDTLYGQAAGSGNGQTHVPYGTAATASYIAQRDLNGQLLVPETPTANNMAASKKYVDDNAGGQSPIAYAGDLIVGNSSGEESRLAIGSAGQVLTVNSTGNGLEYTSIEGVPSYTNTDADKALKVNSAGTGLEWASASGSQIHIYLLKGSSGATGIYFSNTDGITNRQGIAADLYAKGYTGVYAYFPFNGTKVNQALISNVGYKLIIAYYYGLYSSNGTTLYGLYNYTGDNAKVVDDESSTYNNVLYYPNGALAQSETITSMGVVQIV